MSDGFEIVPHVRIPYVRSCTLRNRARRIHAVTCNISVLGVYVTFLRPSLEPGPSMGEAVALSFPLPGDPALLESDARVTWLNLAEPSGAESLPPGCGLRFVRLPAEDHHRIGALVYDYQNAADPRVAAPRPYSGFIRIPLVRPCLLVSDGGTWDGVLCNISLLGAYVAVDPAPPIGERVRLACTAFDVHQLEAAGDVVWVVQEMPSRAEGLPPGCGIRFTDLNDTARRHLVSLIDEYELLPRPGLEP